jgi:aspartate aminotransferase
VPRIVPTDDRFIPRLEVLENAIGPGTKAVLINSPNNPTGVVYWDDFLRQLGELLTRMENRHGTQILLISDEPYRKIVYDQRQCPQIWPHYRDCVVVTSHSKDLALPGERIGYIATHPECGEREELVDGFVYCNRTLGYVNAPALMQRLIRSLQSVTVSVPEYQRKRDFVYGNLKQMGFSLLKPEGAFYVFPKSPIPDDVGFVKELQQRRVLVVPGIGFGLPGYFRASYCLDDKTLEGSMAGFREVARKFKLC